MSLVASIERLLWGYGSFLRPIPDEVHWLGGGSVQINDIFADFETLLWGLKEIQLERAWSLRLNAIDVRGKKIVIFRT